MSRFAYRKITFVRAAITAQMIRLAETANSVLLLFWTEQCCLLFSHHHQLLINCTCTYLYFQKSCSACGPQHPQLVCRIRRYPATSPTCCIAPVGRSTEQYTTEKTRSEYSPVHTGHPIYCAAYTRVFLLFLTFSPMVNKTRGCYG